MSHAVTSRSIRTEVVAPRWLRALLGLVALSLALAGCGGGGGAGASPSLTIELAPQGSAVADGESALLVVVASGPRPLSYQWHRDGAPISGATNPVYVTPALSVDDSGAAYTVAVQDGQAALTSTPATVTVNPIAPALAQQPQTQSVEAGQAATFSAIANGSPPLRYQWQRNGVDIAGADAASFTTPPTTAQDGGARYRVLVRNAAGEAASDEAVLQVGSAGSPVARTVLQLGVVSPGQSVAISTTLSGTAPYTWQWLRNGEPVSGASGAGSDPAVEFVTPALSAADDGVRYALSVTNADGVARSSGALLSVMQAPTVAAGGAHSLARSRDGSAVWAWGDNAHGQLGLGNTAARSLPGRIEGLSGVTAIAAGSAHSLALKSDGSVWAWGGNANGAIGDGTTTDRATPQQVQGLAGVVAIAAGDGRSFALRADGSLWAWGENASGALGVAHANAVLVPTAVGQGVSGFGGIVAVASGARHTLALRADGRVFAMGEVAVSAGSGSSPLLSPALVDGLASVSGIAAGDAFSLALDIHGRLWSWGGNGHGQLGLGDTQDRAAAAPLDLAQSGALLLPSLRLAAGSDFAAARSLDGSLRIWGGSASGQLGTGDGAADAPAPVAVLKMPAPVNAVATGRAHVLAVRADGKVYAWGDNSAGQLGIGSSEARRSEPVQILSLDLH